MKIYVFTGFNDGEYVFSFSVTAYNSHQAIEIAKAFIKLGYNSLEDIASATKLPLDEVKKLAKQNTPVTTQ